MKTLLTIALMALSFNAFAAEEEILNCYFVEEIYVTSKFPTNEQLDKGWEAYERCIEGKTTAEEREQALELQRNYVEPAEPKHIQKGFYHKNRTVLRTTLG